MNVFANHYSINIDNEEAAFRLRSRYDELYETVAGLTFDWTSEPFEVNVYLPTIENRGCSALGLRGLCVYCHNKSGNFNFDIA